MSWHKCKNILVIRPDNMGDIIMMTPALHALKKTFECKISLLTSIAGSLITPYIPSIDETLAYNFPWVKTPEAISSSAMSELIKKLKSFHFDGAIISTVYSQGPLPAALLAYQAGIPLRAAYCRENPYQLLTDWLPDKEPYSFIQHQVIREMQLVAKIGALKGDDTLSLSYNKNCYISICKKLSAKGIDCSKPWIIVHPGVSEDKRKYPETLWKNVIQQLSLKTDTQLLITGSLGEQQLAENIIQETTTRNVFNVASLFNIEEFICLNDYAQEVISVNTVTIHIAAAMQTPVVALYALTNPQHIPWKTCSSVLLFSVPENIQSNNEVVRHVTEKYKTESITYPSPEEVVTSALSLLQVKNKKPISYIETI